MNNDVLETYRLLAMSGPQGKKSDAIRVLCDEIDRIQKRNGKRNGFVPPTMEELKAYAREIGINTVSECSDFRDHYQANGWKVGRVQMVDWKAAMRKWKRSPFRSSSSSPVNGTDPIGWKDFIAVSNPSYVGNYRHAPEYLRIEFARAKKAKV